MKVTPGTKTVIQQITAEITSTQLLLLFCSVSLSVVPQYIELVTGLSYLHNNGLFTTDDMLRENLAAAIASCAPYGRNTQELGRLRCVAPIVGYMISKNARVHRTTAMALQRLSVDPQNCITMHQSGVVPFLLETVGSKDKELQEASAGCLQNIRELALRAEEFKLKRKG